MRIYLYGFDIVQLPMTLYLDGFVMYNGDYFWTGLHDSGFPQDDTWLKLLIADATVRTGHKSIFRNVALMTHVRMKEPPDDTE
jgi:hypothetical protein